MSQALKKLWRDVSGAAAIEYPLVIALIAIAMIVALVQLGGSLNQLFSTTAGLVSPVAAASPAPPAPPDDDDDDD